ncbi:MAG TPA: sulfatase-like hydrolase/transferase, partial [Thermoanaerobaculia bacterium]|nr:sulfatase-like hydrolase/transferase [Thermoanaerobaculia bacterium]
PPRRPPPHAGPIVLITLSSLRADVVGGLGGEPGLTPFLDELIRGADWAGRAVAPSSWTVPAMASIWTGLRPWQHQTLGAAGDDSRATLGADLLTLPEALRAAGYRTHGFHSGDWLSGRFGYGRGFDDFADLGDGDEALDRLEQLPDGREFVWIHLPQPGVPYVRRVWLAPKSSDIPELLPHSIETDDLEPYFDPAVKLPEAKRELFWAMYRLNAAWADQRLGLLLQALRKSGRWDRTLIVVAADHGEDFGAPGQVFAGGNLGRQLLEVPLVVKLPAGWKRPLGVARGERAGTQRLWSTLVEAVGGTPPPVAAPSLFRRLPQEPVLSELYDIGGANQFSLVQGDFQLLWESRFAPPPPSYFGARFRSLCGPLDLARDPEAAVAAVLRRSASAFDAALPLSGDGRPRIALERWESTGSRPVSDPPRAAAMARLLAADWNRFVPAERSPAEEARRRGGGRSAV